MIDESKDWRCCAPASSEAIVRLRNAAGVELPEDYFALLAFSNGGDGPLSLPPRGFMLYSAEDTTACWTKKLYDEFFPGFLVFGSNGAGELIAFDTRENPPWPIVMIDATNIDLTESVVRIAANFTDFRQAIGSEYVEETG